VEVALDAGPRILGFARRGGPQLFATLPDAVIDHPAVGPFRFLGGHRLWRAPEEPVVTYAPDDQPVWISELDGGLEVVGQPDSDGVTKTITAVASGDFLIVDHELRNEGPARVRCAPWAITQLAPGGTAHLPQARDAIDADGVLPNRTLVLWPYTDLADQSIRFTRSQVLVAGSGRKAKIGLSNRRGWTAYHNDEELFVKWSPLHRDGDHYVDHGASVQCYRDDRFVELESLGPLAVLAPGEETSHREVWSLLPTAIAGLEDVLESLPPVPELPA